MTDVEEEPESNDNNNTVDSSSDEDNANNPDDDDDDTNSDDEDDHDKPGLQTHSHADSSDGNNGLLPELQDWAREDSNSNGDKNVHTWQQNPGVESQTTGVQPIVATKARQFEQKQRQEWGGGSGSGSGSGREQGGCNIVEFTKIHVLLLYFIIRW